MKTLAAVALLLLAAPAMADSVPPTGRYYSERPIRGERIIELDSVETLWRKCGIGTDISACSLTRFGIIYVLGVGVWGTTAAQQRCDIIHERGHLLGWPFDHPNARFCQ